MNTGVESIRINGRRIEDLPMAANAHAKQQLPLVRDTERQNSIENILAKYPNPSVVYLESRIKECHENVQRCKDLKAGMYLRISNYETNIAQVGVRESELERLDPTGYIRTAMAEHGAKRLRANIEGIKIIDIPLPDDIADKVFEIKNIKANFPPYDIGSLKDQIIQFKETINKCDDVIGTEYASVAELSMTLALCKQRDLELRGFGASIKS